MYRSRFLCFLACLCFAASRLPAQVAASTMPVYNVRNLGAKGDGRTSDTVAINRAIASANGAGGGTVWFAPGIYRSGTLKLLSNVTLHLEAGAVLQGSSNAADYGSTEEYGFGDRYGFNSSGEGKRVGLLVARGAENIAITGRGRIDGNGDSFFNLKSFHNTPDFNSQYTRQGADYDAPKYGIEFGPIDPYPAGRPGTLIILSECKNILVSDVTISNAPNWTLHLQRSEGAVIHGIHIANNPLIPNNDGIDCMACKRVQISDCDIRAGDDDFAIVGSEDVHVANCSLWSYSAAIRLEDSRFTSFDNLSIHSNRGLAIFGRGNEHTVHAVFSNITMETKLITGHWWGKAEPIYIAARGGEGADEIRDVHFVNITADAESGIVLWGGEDSRVQDISFTNVNMHVRAPESRIAQSVGGNFDLRWTAQNLQEAIFKHDIPALYARYVDRLRIRGFQLTWDTGLPAYFTENLQTENCRGLDMSDFASPPPPRPVSRKP